MVHHQYTNKMKCILNRTVSLTWLFESSLTGSNIPWYVSTCSRQYGIKLTLSVPIRSFWLSNMIGLRCWVRLVQVLKWNLVMGIMKMNESTERLLSYLILPAVCLLCFLISPHPRWLLLLFEIRVRVTKYLLPFKPCVCVSVCFRSHSRLQDGLLF